MISKNRELIGQLIRIAVLVILGGLVGFVFSALLRTYSVPSPVFDPESVVSQGWQSWVSEPDVITGVKSHLVATRGVMVGEDPRNSQYRDDPTLILRCQNDELDIIVHWGGRFISDSLSWYIIPRVPTTLRFDDAPPVDTASSESTDNEFTFLKRPSKFTSQLINSEQMIVRITDFGDEQETAQFTIVGLAEHWANLPCAR